MTDKATIEIINEKDDILESIETTKSKINTFDKLKEIISSKFDVTYKTVEYYIIDDNGQKIQINNNKNYKQFKNIHLYKIKIIETCLPEEDFSLKVFEINNNFDKEKAINVKDSLRCWICLGDSAIENPFFCPNIKCLKGVHEECLKQRKEKESIVRCICGNFYNVNEWKSNKLVNQLAEFAIKTNKNYIDKITNLESEIKKIKSNQKKCEKHPNDFLVHYCYDCHEAFCGTCFIYEVIKHKNHRLMNYQKYIELNISHLENNEQIINLNNILEEYENKINLIEKNKKYILESLQKIIDNITNKFDEIIEKTKVQKEKLISKNKDIINVTEKIKKFFDNLDKEKYNELENIDEIKQNFNLNTFKIEIDNNEELKNINNITEIIDNVSNNFKKIIENQNIFDPKYIIDNNGNKYIGEMINNIKEGKGILYYKNGDIYEGEFKNNKMEGRGIFHNKLGCIYDGEFKDDKFNGRGLLKLYNGEKYDGIFKNNLFEGRGIFYFEDGKRYEGEFKNCLIEGKGIIYDKNGDISIGKFKAEKKIGKHFILRSNGKFKTQNY